MTGRKNFSLSRSIGFFLYIASTSLAGAADEADRSDDGTADRAAHTDRGADTCLKCHDEEDSFPVMSIFETAHGVQADERTPLADLQCESCHGPGAEHARKVRPDESQAPIMNFKHDSPFAPAVQNDACLQCHADHSRTGWQGSTHEQNEVMCSQCHTAHVRHDPVLQDSEQAEICYDCHKKERSELMRASVHPVRFGIMTCSNCHDAHDSWATALLRQPTLNETCFECHAEKRGPFLWEHAPASEDCSSCHTPHGSNNAPLLTKRAPLLCQQCHTQAGHPSIPWDGKGLSGGSDPFNRQFVLAQGCLNCHSQVHGSNHPSGVKLMR